MERHLATLWERVADAVPEATAVVHGDVRRSYRELEQRSARLAGALAAAGLGAGTKVAQYLYNGSEYVESYFAALKIRATPVNVNYRYLDDELLYLLENSESEALVFHSSLADRVARIRDRATGVKLFLEVDDGGPTGTVPGADGYEAAVAGAAPAPRVERDPDDVLLLYTGGTTGMPKGVMTRNAGAVAGAIGTIASVTGQPPAEDAAGVPELVRTYVAEHGQFVTLPACPLMHGTGMAALAPTLGGGGKLVLLAGRGLDVEELWDTVEREGVNSLVIVGDAFARPMLRGLREGRSRDLACVRFIFSAGAMFSEEIRAGLLEHLPTATIVDNIAASEGGMGVALSTKGNVVPTGSFLPNPGVKLFTEDGVEVAPGSGEIGMVAIPASNGIPDGYFHDREKTAKTFREFGGVRYSIPGDWGTIGADGILTLLGRGSQCINTGGEKVFPEEVEETLKTHPAVEDALVFGLPDERFGQRVAAVVSLAPGIDASSIEPKTIVDEVRTKLSSYKLPRDVAVVATVPRAANGKADYPRARELFESEVSPRQ